MGRTKERATGHCRGSKWIMADGRQLGAVKWEKEEQGTTIENNK